MQSEVAAKTSSIGLAFIAYPTAIETLPWPNFWTIILGLTLFTLGVDSAFGMVEATATVITDTSFGRVLPRKLVALVLCAFGICFSFLFCFNWGFTYFDVVDHYLAIYLLFTLGVLQSFGAGWIYQMEETIRDINKVTVWVNLIGFWSILLPLAMIAYFAFPDDSWMAIPIFWGCQIIVWIISFVTSKVSFSVWYGRVWLLGMRKLSRAIAKPTTGG